MASLSSFLGAVNFLPSKLSAPMRLSHARNGVGAGSFGWEVVQPIRGGPFNFSSTDEALETAQAGNVTLLPILAYTAAWAAGPSGTHGPATNRSDWESYVRATVERYIPRGVRFYQVWNEPTLEAGFWNGSSNAAWVSEVYVPAARIVRSLGGRVVFGGWPCSNSLEELDAILETAGDDGTVAWRVTDVLDMHYREVGGWAAAWAAWHTRIPALWQTEVGWLTEPNFIPSFYPRALHWSLQQAPRDADTFRIYWYAFWSPSLEKGLTKNGPAPGEKVLTEHGRRLDIFTRLLGESPHATGHSLVVEPPLPLNGSLPNRAALEFSRGAAGAAIVLVYDAIYAGAAPAGVVTVRGNALRRAVSVDALTSGGDPVRLNHTAADGTASFSVKTVPLEPRYRGKYACVDSPEHCKDAADVGVVYLRIESKAPTWD